MNFCSRHLHRRVFALLGGLQLSRGDGHQAPGDSTPESQPWGPHAPRAFRERASALPSGLTLTISFSVFRQNKHTRDRNRGLYNVRLYLVSLAGRGVDKLGAFPIAQGKSPSTIDLQQNLH